MAVNVRVWNFGIAGIVDRDHGHFDFPDVGHLCTESGDCDCKTKFPELTRPDSGITGRGFVVFLLEVSATDKQVADGGSCV